MIQKARLSRQAARTPCQAARTLGHRASPSSTPWARNAKRMFSHSQSSSRSSRDGTRRPDQSSTLVGPPPPRPNPHLNPPWPTDSHGNGSEAGSTAPFKEPLVPLKYLLYSDSGGVHLAPGIYLMLISLIAFCRI